MPTGFARGDDFGQTALVRNDGGNTANQGFDGGEPLGLGPRGGGGHGPCAGKFGFEMGGVAPAQEVDLGSDSEFGGELFEELALGAVAGDAEAGAGETGGNAGEGAEEEVDAFFTSEAADEQEGGLGVGVRQKPSGGGGMGTDRGREGMPWAASSSVTHWLQVRTDWQAWMARRMSAYRDWSRSQ